jgi:CubicO group peptidase (beta-lactamase class C family)
MAVEEGKIKLDATINPYFPELTNADSITIAQLLYHQSGIHDFTTNTDYLEWNTKPIGKNQLLDIIIKGGSDFQPGTNTVYSNSNYVLLTLLLEKIYGISYPKLLESKITNPARLKDTYFGKPSDIRDNECFSYTFQGEWVREKETDMSVPLGAGSIVSTPADIAKFAHQLFQGRILTKTSLEIMKTAPGQFGMGLIKIPFYHRNGYGHTGGIDGFHSVFAYFPDMEICLVICSNATNFKINDISIALLCTAYNLPFDVPVFSKFKPTADQLAKYAGIYQGEEIPLKITIKQKENTLVAQATGQPAFGLEAFEKDKFRFEQAGIIIEFQAESNSFLLKQGGGIFHFSKL